MASGVCERAELEMGGFQAGRLQGFDIVRKRREG
jgi:hypothetical protein